MLGAEFIDLRIEKGPATFLCCIASSKSRSLAPSSLR